jgi:hypothetical protein
MQVESPLLIACVGFVYLYIAIEQYMKGNIGMSITYFGYALGNVGLYMLAQ